MPSFFLSDRQLCISELHDSTELADIHNVRISEFSENTIKDGGKGGSQKIKMEIYNGICHEGKGGLTCN